MKNHPIVELTFWSPGDPRTDAIDALLADPHAPLAKHGLTGIADVYARSTGAHLHDLHAEWADEMSMKSLGVDGALSEVAPTLRASGVDFFIAKGPAIAYFDYPDARMRPYTDLDVYVPTGLLDETRDVLHGLGYERVAQVIGPLGGLGSELHGGAFGVVVEVHGHVIDNLHRDYVASTSSWLPHVVDRQIMGIDVPVLSGAAHLALQAIHLGAGHRYQKLVLYRDIAARAKEVCDITRMLGAGSYLAVALDVLARFGFAESSSVMPRGLLHNRLVQALWATNPTSWDEYSASVLNGLALTNQPTTAHALKSAASGLRALVPQGGRRAPLRWGAA